MAIYSLRLWFWCSTALFSACLGCAADDGREVPVAEGDGGETTATGAGDSGSGPDSASEPDGDTSFGTDNTGAGCSEASQKIYVVDKNNKGLYSFSPPTKAFALIGNMSCAGMGSPFSMAVSRDDVAYVLGVDGSQNCTGLYAVSIEDASCLGKTAFKCESVARSPFGMGFATDGPNTTQETLYLGVRTGTALWAMDVASFSVAKFGTLPSPPEMTGNSLGELWGYFASSTPAFVAQIDKSSGQTSNNITLNGVPSGSNVGYAFAGWGGDFYVFVYEDQGTTQVYRVSNGQVALYVPSTQRHIVGAGVSTCAPITPVK